MPREMTPRASSVGRVKTVLIFGADEDAVGVTTSIVARVREDSPGDRLLFSGCVAFDEATAGHLTGMVLPVVDRVFTPLGFPLCDFEVSAVNLGVASVRDLGLRVTGHSADVSVLLALLSAALGMSVPEDVVFTGHVASPDGDIAAVRALPAKVRAAQEDGAVHTFVHAALDRDTSLASLSPRERSCAEEAIRSARKVVRVVAVRDIAELMPVAFSEEGVILASLRMGLFNSSPPTPTSTGPIGAAIDFLTRDGERRFFAVLEHLLFAAESERARHMLQERVRHHIEQRTYPTGLGRGLLQLVKALPPATRRLKTVFPLLPISDCIHLSQFATDKDHRDVVDLQRAALGEGMSRIGDRPIPPDSTSQTRSETEHSALDVILSEIDAEALANTIGLPIDTARASFTMDCVTVDSHEEFNDTVAAFHLRLLRHTGRVTEMTDSQAAAPDAHALLERAFSRSGGTPAALAEARDGTRGGLRFVLDALAEQFKREEQEKHVSRVFKETLDPLDWGARVDLMRALLERLSPHLPPEIRAQPAARYAKHHEEIVRAHVRSLDSVRQVLRRM